MRRIFLFVFTLSLCGLANAQDSTKLSTISHKNMPRSSDHFMLQLGYLSWNGIPDTINTGGIPRTFNVYLLMDFPFKTNPKFSAAIGAGFGTDHMFFDETFAAIKDKTNEVRFLNQKDTFHFKKHKLTTAYLEAPVELRFSSKPDDSRRSFKVAIGAKVGTLLSAHTKSKTLLDKTDNTTNEYKMKEFSKQFFNKNRLAATARIGYGHFSLFGSYQVTPLFQEGRGPKVNPMSVGLTLSGL